MATLQYNTLIQRVLSVVSAAGTTTLTNVSERNIEVTGTNTQTIKLPDATTSKVGREFYICNRSTLTVTVVYDDSTTLTTLTADTEKLIYLTDKSTTNGVWDVSTGGGGSGGFANSEVRLYTGNGYGSVGTRIRRFTNVKVNTGSDITYTDSATNGASFTINTNGVYSMGWHDRKSVTGNQLGFSLNSSDLTISIDSLSESEILEASWTPAEGGQVTFCGYFTAGDVIRPQDDNDNNESTVPRFFIVRVQ
jgi:membrane-bound inhibitor of C-type lysozyme